MNLYPANLNRYLIFDCAFIVAFVGMCFDHPPLDTLTMAVGAAIAVGALLVPERYDDKDGD